MRAIIVLFCLCIYSTALAQKRPIKFGKISKEELKLSECEFYPDANAMILAEYADIYFLEVLVCTGGRLANLESTD